MSSPPHSAPRPPLRVAPASSSYSTTKPLAGPTSPGYASGPLSPTSSMSDHGASSPVASPVEESFFGAIASSLRRARSRSRNRSGVRVSRSKSPMQLPPNNLPSTASSAQPLSPTHNSSRQQRPRHASHQSQSSITSVPPSSPRPTTTRRTTAGSDPWRGRHSNEWLFNGLSITDKVHGLVSKRNSSS